MEIIAGVVALERYEAGAAVVGAQHDRVHRINAIGIGRVRSNLAEIPIALPDARVGALAHPRDAGIVRAIQAAFLAIDECIDSSWRGSGDRHANAADDSRESVTSDLRPVIPTIDGFIQAAAGTAGWRIDIPRRAPRLPQRGIDHVGVVGLERKIDRPGIVILAKNFLPTLAAIARTEHTALRVRPIGVTERGDIDEVRIARMHEDLADLLRIGQSRERPRLSGIGGFVYAVALRDIRTHVGLATADIDDPGIGRRNSERADRSNRLAIEDRLPGAAGIAGFPHAAVDRAEIEMIRLARHASDGKHAAAAERANVAPVQVLEQRRVERLRRSSNDHKTHCKCKAETEHHGSRIFKQALVRKRHKGEGR